MKCCGKDMDFVSMSNDDGNTVTVTWKCSKCGKYKTSTEDVPKKP